LPAFPGAAPAHRGREVQPVPATMRRGNISTVGINSAETYINCMRDQVERADYSRGATA
jgi:hypothetical protein